MDIPPHTSHLYTHKAKHILEKERGWKIGKWSNITETSKEACEGRVA